MQNLIRVSKIDSSEQDALRYWLSKMSNRAKGTTEKYNSMFKKFSDWIGETPDQIITKRMQDRKSDDMNIKYRYEDYLTQFMNHLKVDEKYSTASQQVAWAGVKSFFEAHRLKLDTRKSDYPKGVESLGARAFSKDELRRLIKDTKMSNRSQMIVMCLKDSGLGVGDLATLTYGDIAKQLENNEEFISLKFNRKKTGIMYRTFFGPESTELLRKYMQVRRKGTRRVDPENITNGSPLIRKRENFEFVSRSGLSSLVADYVSKIGLSDELSAHSLRKYTQTQLESAGMHSNWVKQILAHSLGVENSYSRPSDEMLRESYSKCYDSLRVFDKGVNSQHIQQIEEELERARKENMKLRTELDRVIAQQKTINEILKPIIEADMEKRKQEWKDHFGDKWEEEMEKRNKEIEDRAKKEKANK